MIRIPRNHLADETLARIAVAAKRARARGKAPELEPDDTDLVDLPPSLMPARPMQPHSQPQQQPEAGGAGDTAGAAELVPPLNESGLDTGLVLQGADSFDALLKT